MLRQPVGITPEKRLGPGSNPISVVYRMNILYNRLIGILSEPTVQLLSSCLTGQITITNGLSYRTGFGCSFVPAVYVPGRGLGRRCLLGRSGQQDRAL